MQNSQNINSLTLVLSENKFLNETKSHTTPPPLFKLNGRSLIDHEMNHENGGNSLWLIHLIIYLNKALF